MASDFNAGMKTPIGLQQTLVHPGLTEPLKHKEPALGSLNKIWGGEKDMKTYTHVCVYKQVTRDGKNYGVDRAKVHNFNDIYLTSVGFEQVYHMLFLMEVRSSYLIRNSGEQNSIRVSWISKL